MKLPRRIPPGRASGGNSGAPAHDAPLKAFMKIPDIEGESLEGDHQDEIDIFDIVWAVESDRPAGSLHPSGHVQLSQVMVRKFLDKSSLYLAYAVATNQAFDEITLSVRDDSVDTAVDYFTITLSDCRIAAYRAEKAEGRRRIEEEVEIAFDTFTGTYTPQAPDGTAGAQHEVTIERYSAV